MPRTTGLAVTLFLPFASALADGAPTTRTICVNGVATVQVVPDEVVISLGVETFATTLEDARKMNSKRIERIREAVAGQGLELDAMRSGHMNVSPRYEYVDGAYRRDRLAGYDVSRQVEVTLGDISKLEPLMSALLAGGANAVHSLDFRTTELRKHKDEARRLALEAAREKAVQMAGVLGQTIGRPIRIVESGDGQSGRLFFDLASNTNALGDSFGEPVSSETFLPGMIPIRAGMSVEFELN